MTYYYLFSYELDIIGPNIDIHRCDYRFTETLTKIYNPYKNISEIIYEMEECSFPGYHSHRVIVITLLPSNFDYS